MPAQEVGMMTFELLEKIGLCWLGEHWRNGMAEILDVDRRTLQRWEKSGTVPSGVRRDLLLYLQERAATATQIMEMINGHQTPQ